MNPVLKRYPRVKDSGTRWVGDVPEHWDILPNRAVFAEVNDRGHSFAPMLAVTIARGVISQAALLKDSSKKDSSRLDRSQYKLVRPGDIAYNKMRAWQGALGASAHQGIVSPAYVVQRPRGASSARYLHYLLRTPAFAKEAERWSYGITSDMWSLRPEHFRMIRICHPPLTEQAAIARFLDHADRKISRYIAAKERLIALLDEYKQALVHQAVTGQIDVRTGRPYPQRRDSGVASIGVLPAHWKARRLRFVCDMRVSNVDKHAREGEQSVRLCNYVDVYYNDYIRADMDFMAATARPEEIRRFGLRPGDVLMTKDSEAWDDIGIPSLVESSAPDLVSGYHLALLRPHEGEIRGGFLFRAIQSRAVALQLHVSANGVTRYGLSHGAMTSILVPLPPLAEQAAIVGFLDGVAVHVRRASENTRRQIEALAEYRTRLVADVVTGKVDVREAGAALLDLDAVENHAKREDELDGAAAVT